MSPKRRHRLRRPILLGLATALVAALLWLWQDARPGARGQGASGARLERMQRSPQWEDGGFVNSLPRVDGSMAEATLRFFFGGSAHREPAEPLPVLSRRGADYTVPPASGLRVTWLGHSTLLVEVDGKRVLVDPVWGERISPFSSLGPKRWYEPPLPLAELPEVDVVLISHDHYDHLDHPTVLELAKRGVTWAVPLGVGAHLESWGIPDDKIAELDWWEHIEIDGMRLTATPARHFSGRWIDDSAQTLWCGWAITGPVHRVYYSGDTALVDSFIDVGKRLGPFDLTMIEVGAYDPAWADVHLGPEQAVRAHRLVQGKVFLPVHWGLFDLALHGWTEPIERVLVAAEREGVQVLAPRPGEMLEPGAPAPGGLVRWWPQVPWESAEAKRVRSTGVDHLMAGELVGAAEQGAEDRGVPGGGAPRG